VRRDYTLLGPLEAARSSGLLRAPHSRGPVFSPTGRRPAGRAFRGDRPLRLFYFQATRRIRSVWVATGTGIAPFVAFVRAGVRGFDLLHGCGPVAELYYRDELSRAARAIRAVYLRARSARL
jgi:benzoate/toluate 1,2-dioxygenase reductase component